MFDVRTWLSERPMSSAITLLRSGGKAYLKEIWVSAAVFLLDLLTPYHDQKAMKNPSHEKRNTRPCTQSGFRTGIERALLLRGLISGGVQSSEGENIFGLVLERQ